MLIKKITYLDYNKVTRTEEFYFNLTQAEVIEMEYITSGGLSVMIDRLLALLIFRKLLRS